MQIGVDRIDQLGDRPLAACRARHIGFVFQFYNLMAALDAERNVELPLLLTHLSEKERREHGEAIITVTHDPHDSNASPRASRTVYLDEGQLSPRQAA